MKDSIARRIVVKGLVQGIGYRPFVAELAEKYQITGWVRNTAGIVTVLAVGETGRMEQFLSVFSETSPSGAWVKSLEIENVELEELNPSEYKTFTIEVSEEDSGAKVIPYIPPDLPTCTICESQLLDRGDRRYRYPFISCTSCGPRYSIIERLPYDRDTITMKEFGMCEECAKEYTGKGDMRRHAQTIACHTCGPVLEFVSVESEETGTLWNMLKDDVCYGSGIQQPTLQEDVIPQKNIAFGRGTDLQEGVRQKEEAAQQEAVHCLSAGGIVAIKDIGGFHLACSPYNEKAVAALRWIKGREKKPFAVMFPDVGSVRGYCQVSKAEEEQLLSPPRPIVLLRKRSLKERELLCGNEQNNSEEQHQGNPNTKGNFAENVCGNSPDIGAMLPCNPLQILLTKELGPLIMTSANRSGELMIIDNEEMLSWMQECKAEGTPLGILQHDRKILTPLDDSIVRIAGGYRQVFRRARGMVPAPVQLPYVPSDALHIFAAGGDLKASFCFTAGNQAYLSQHLGDLEDEKCFLQYEKEVQRIQNLFGFEPERKVVDMHPAYLSANRVLAKDETEVVCRIQHHHAHGASVIAEHGLRGKVLCITFDGTGYGVDNTIWGSEFFLWDEMEMKRVGHLKPVDLIGGNEGAKNTDTILYGYFASFGNTWNEILEQNSGKMPWIKVEYYKIVQAALQQKINSVTSSSMGRLFDAVSALLNICHYNSYEGEAPIELEYLAVKAEKPYPLQIHIVWEEEQKRYFGDTKTLFEGIIKGLTEEVPKEELALGFILSVADFVCNMCQLLKTTAFAETEKKQVTLSGGTFQNKILLEETAKRLKEAGFIVYLNEQVPSGDGGICLGQAYLGQVASIRKDY